MCAKHLRVFGVMCAVADRDNKLARTKIDPRGKINLLVGYSTHHAGDVYRLLNPKTSRVIHSRDVKWTGKTWAEFHENKMIDRASGYVDPDEDIQLEEEQNQDVEEEEFNRILSKVQKSFWSCTHVNSCSILYFINQSTYFIEYFIQGNFKYPRINKIHQFLEKITRNE